MSDLNNHNEQSPEPDDETFRPLRGTLRGLPKVAAPADFEFRLRQAIAAENVAPAPPWWKRFFLPAREGGFRMPVYAYGAVAAVLVVVFSYYVYQRTDMEQQVREQGRPEEQRVEEPGISPGATPGTPGPHTETIGPATAGHGDRRETVGPAEGARKTEPAATGVTSESGTVEPQGRNEMNTPADKLKKDATPEARPAPAKEEAAPAVMENKKRDAVNPAPSIKAMPLKQHMLQEKSGLGGAQDRKKSSEARDEEMPATRGLILDNDVTTLAPDSARRDSLRRLDSLRRAR
jgi:hypothetical protein